MQDESQLLVGTELLPLVLEDGQIVYVEAKAVPGEALVASHLHTLQDLCGQVQHIAAGLLKSVAALSPEKVTLEFGLQFAAQAGKLTSLVIGGSAQSNIKIQLEWKPGTSAPQPKSEA